MIKGLRLFTFTLCFLFVLPQTVSSKIEKTKEPSIPKIQSAKFVQDEIIIKYKNNINVSENKVNINSKYSLTPKNIFKTVGTEVVRIPSNTDVETIIGKIKSDNSVEYVQPNYIYYPADISQDERSSELWGLHNTGQLVGNQAGISGMDINLKNAWMKTQGSESVVVAVIDTGVDINHPDLKDRIWVNTSEIADNGIDDDKNGYIDDINGWDFYHNDNTVYDVKDGDRHGTHVAGTIAANSNEIGVVGVAPKVKIMPLKFIGPMGGTTADAILAINYAKSMGVKISNNSWGGSGYDSALKEAIESSNSLFIAAAGNEGEYTDYYPNYPSAFDSANILSVAAVDNRGKLAYFSNFGEKTVDIAAPGVNILSTISKTVDIGAAVQYEGENYKTFVQGMSLNSIAYKEQRLTYLNKVLGFFGINESSSILLVVDDESQPSDYDSEGTIFENSLTELGIYNTDKYYVQNGWNGPSLEVLNNYDLVIWVTDNAEYSTLTEWDIENLKSYLNNNKGLYLAGNFISYALFGTSLAKDYLHVSYLYNDDLVGNLLGIDNTDFYGQVMDIYDIYCDRIETADDKAKVVLEYKGDVDYSNSYNYLNGTSMAAPHVSGIAALLYSKGVEYPTTIKDKILLGAKPLNTLTGLVSTGGMADAYNALKYVEDFNNDTSINIVDLAQLARYYNKKVSYDVNTMFDLNNDGTINIFDLVLLSKEIK